MYIQIKARKIHFVSGSIRLRGYNVHRNKAIYILCPAQSGSEVTMYIQIKQGKYILCPAQSGSEVTMYIQIKQGKYIQLNYSIHLLTIHASYEYPLRSQSFSPRIRLASCISLGWTVTRLAWMARRLASSMIVTR